MEIAACRPWLQAEIALVKPDVIVALGATAAQALLGPKFRVTKQRGEFLESTLAPYLMATVHPSSILRALNDEPAALNAAVLSTISKNSLESLNKPLLLSKALDAYVHVR